MTGLDDPDWVESWVEIDSVDGYESSDWTLIQHDWILQEADDDDYDNYSDQEGHEGIKEVEDDDEEENYDCSFLEIYEKEQAKEREVLMEVIKHQVLPRLPAKSLLRFKSTSHQWNGYISSPLFIHIHSLLYRSVTGLFFHNPSGSPSFAAFDGDPNPLPDPTLSFLPELVHIKSSTGGLICGLGCESSNYYICNPMTTEWTVLPPTLNDHGPDPSVVIVMQEPSAFNFSADYYVVCSYELFEGIYAFESFSSASRQWRRSNEIVAAERIVSGSGVSAGGCAYWRTTMQSIVACNPDKDSLWTVASPAEDAIWEIGELGRTLCCVTVEGEAVEVMVLEDGSEGKWRKVTKLAMETWEVGGEGESVVPLRAQGDREVVLWEGRSRTVVARNVVDGSQRLLADSEALGYCADFLPYVSSLVHVQRYVPS